MSNRKTRLINKIIYGQKAEELSDEAKELLWSWFTDPDEDNEAEEIFEKLFLEEIGRMGSPSEKALTTHKILRKRLGLDGQVDRAVHDLFLDKFDLSGKPSRKIAEKLPVMKELLGIDTPPRKIPLCRRYGVRIAVAAVAAVAVFALVLSGLWFLSGDRTVPETPQIATVTPAPETSVPAQQESVFVSTLAGEQKHLFLPDGSEIWLNESSSLKYPEDFTGERIVELDGEAYFSVRRAGGTPFLVKADDLTVTVRGTRFNVLAYAGTPEAEVRLDAGEIDVTAGRDTRVIRPNNKVVLEKQTDRVRTQEVSEEDMEPWRSGMEFRSAPLKEVLASTANYFNMKIEMPDSMPDDYITFAFGYEHPPEVVFSILRNTHKYFSYEIANGVIRIKTTENQ